jgi:predicted  nucleic acid-binding Zn-ribbon protein
MSDIAWVKRELDRYENEEEETMKRLAKARSELTRAKAEYSATKELLAGIRGGKKEFLWQLDYWKEHGRLP